MKYSLSLLELDNQLKKRTSIPYLWGKKQNNSDDKKTNFIYQSPFFHQIQEQIKSLEPELHNYAWNRWYNFWSAKGVESIFTQQKNIFPAENTKDKEKDFYISGVPFDHKTTVFPKGFQKSFEYAQHNPKELVVWLYENQSQEQRKHWKNRFFIVLYDSKKNQHWKIKSELLFLHRKISAILENYSLNDCISFEKDGKKRYAGLIWIAV